MIYGHLDYFQKPPLGGRLKTKPGDHGTVDVHSHWFVLFSHARGLAWINNHSDSIWLRARPHTTSHYARRSVTVLLDFGGVLGRPLDTFVCALSFSQFHGHGTWAHVWKGHSNVVDETGVWWAVLGVDETALEWMKVFSGVWLWKSPRTQIGATPFIMALALEFISYQHLSLTLSNNNRALGLLVCVIVVKGN